MEKIASTFHSVRGRHGIRSNFCIVEGNLHRHFDQDTSKRGNFDERNEEAFTNFLHLQPEGFDFGRISGLDREDWRFDWTSKSGKSSEIFDVPSEKGFPDLLEVGTSTLE